MTLVQEPRDDEQAEPQSALIGWQYAAALEAERLHQSLPRGTSPLAGIGYDVTRGEGDLFRFTTSPVDQQVTAMVEMALADGAVSTARSRESLTQKDLYTILTYSRRQGLIALREQSVEPVLAGFSALVLIDAERIDWRDAAVAVGLLAHAARRVGLDPVALVAENAGYAEPRTAEMLQRHCDRADEGLAAWGYREVHTSTGLSLANSYGKTYEPTIDLIAVAERVATVIEADRYRVTDIVTGTDLPAVWLPAANDRTHQARDAFRACLTVSAAPVDHPSARSDQMFSVWIAQAASSRAAASVAAAAAPKADSTTALLGLAAGDLCVVVVARSVVMGVPPIETQSSIQRFRRPLLAALSQPDDRDDSGLPPGRPWRAPLRRLWRR